MKKNHFFVIALFMPHIDFRRQRRVSPKCYACQTFGGVLPHGDMRIAPCAILFAAMNTYMGSIQRKGRRYYLVVSLRHRQKWLALRTDKLSLARARAAELAPRDPSDDTPWLRQLVQLGDLARAELVRRRIATDLSWDNLWLRFLAAARPAIPVASQPSYRRWLQLLAQTAKAACPAALSATDAARILTRLRATHLSAGRMALFYRRVWRTLLLDDAIWHDAARAPQPKAEPAKRHEFYRRLSVDEVRRVIGFLSDAALREDPSRPSVRQALADMVTIGFYTGLRLSDVAELERAEISSDGRFFHIQPNKVRHSKARVLTIPLVLGAYASVQRRLLIIRNSKGEGERRFLFTEITNRRPSRMLCAAFRACGVLRQGNGRASFHSLRATFISMMDEAGIPPHITDAITGHAGGGMHARYSQPTPAALLRAVTRALPPL